MKATQLDECRRSYNMANIERNAASEMLEDKVRNLDELHSQVKKWEEKFKVQEEFEYQIISPKCLLSQITGGNTQIYLLYRKPYSHLFF